MSATTGVWDGEAANHMAVIDAQEHVLRELYAVHEKAHAEWLLARPGREAIDAQVSFVSELKNALIARLQAKRRALACEPSPV